MTGDSNRCCRCHCPCLISCNEPLWRAKSWSRNKKKVAYEYIRMIPKYYCCNVSRASWNMNHFASAATSLYVKTSEKNGCMPPIVNLSSHYVVQKFSQSSSKIVSKFCQGCVKVVSYLSQSCLKFVSPLSWYFFIDVSKLSQSCPKAVCKLSLWCPGVVHAVFKWCQLAWKLS